MRDAIGVTSQVAASPTGTKALIDAALARHGEIDDERIGVAVNGDEIILTGETSTSAARDHAGSTAWTAPGVACVLNLLTVVPE